MVFAWVGNYLVRMALPALLPSIIQEMRLSYTSAGLLATSGFFYAYALIQFPAGILGDRYGRRRIVVLGLVAGAAASLATGLAGSFATLLAARVLTGASQGCLFANDRAIIAAVTPPDKIARGQAVSFTGPGLGIMLGLLLGGVLGTLVPWRYVFFLWSMPPLVAAVLIGRSPRTKVGTPVVGAPGARLRRVVARRDLWILGLSGATVMWVQYVLATWAPLLFLEVGVADVGRAAAYASLQGVAGVAGLLAGGWLGDRARQAGVGHKVVVIGSVSAVALGMAGLGMAVGSGQALAVGVAVFVTSFFAWSMWGPSFALLGEIIRGHDVSSGFGLFNTVCVVGAAVGPLVAGWTRDVTASFAGGCYVSALVALGGAALALTLRPASRVARPGV
jgi:MFS family permease